MSNSRMALRNTSLGSSATRYPVPNKALALTSSSFDDAEGVEDSLGVEVDDLGVEENWRIEDDLGVDGAGLCWASLDLSRVKSRMDVCLDPCCSKARIKSGFVTAVLFDRSTRRDLA